MWLTSQPLRFAILCKDYAMPHPISLPGLICDLEFMVDESEYVIPLKLPY